MDFQIEAPEIEIPEIEVPDVEFCEEMDVDCEMEADNAEGNEGGIEVEFEIKKRPCQTPRNPNQKIQHKSQSPRKVNVKDYLCFSVLSITLFNSLFLGTAAMCFSLKALNRKLKRDVKGAKKFSCLALAANICAVLATISTIIGVAVAISLTHYGHHKRGQCYVI
ncbi:uncharacterized protein LOC100034401 [Danio rerio]|uniref:Si:dkey-204f11.3 n=1 Tax=Danio rerio TaxID=7955 RepID=Q5PNN0_DANRE|nr:uncharacterized protein LOC100034401 [Danio rerio]|eukprot:NP_001076517.1 uncharacterized protein LOC100034401 [Danio rerio]